jgi:hypothetical protein
MPTLTKTIIRELCDAVSYDRDKYIDAIKNGWSVKSAAWTPEQFKEIAIGAEARGYTAEIITTRARDQGYYGIVDGATRIRIRSTK